MIILNCVFLFKVTATNETYTDGHTLSLHVVRRLLRASTLTPISIDVRHARLTAALKISTSPPRAGAMKCTASTLAVTQTPPAWRSATTAAKRRSEEHTSELQSLMRISYAVFCSQKQNNHTIMVLTTIK